MLEKAASGADGEKGARVRPTLSFIIPAHDEAEGIDRCVRSIARHAPAGMGREVIVVDNASKDETASIARRAGAMVVASEAPTIAAVRNAGVRVSLGSLLVFLDADCVLTSGWGDELALVVGQMERSRPSCAGSQVIPPSGESVFLWKYWFEPFVMQHTASHVGSAHMICSRDTFDAIGGFDEFLETGEDFDFCARIKRAGGEILNVPSMRVEHYGFPRTWGEFFRRERWHGRGDVGSLRSLASSKVALASLAFVALVFSGIIGLTLGFLRTGLVMIAGAGLVLFAASMVKFRHAGIRGQLASLTILPVYMVARSLSVIDRLRPRPGRPSTA